MGLQLPDWLTEPLGWIGLTWPQADENKLYEAGQAWITFSTQLQPITAHANSAATNVWTNNQGTTADAFHQWWTDEDGPPRRLDDDATAAMVIGGALILFAAITLATKILFIAQLILLAIQVTTALAAAFVSFGASTATIPGLIATTRLACTKLLRKVIDDIIKNNITRLLTQARALLKKVAVRREERRLALEMAEDANRGVLNQIAVALRKINPRYDPRHPEYSANCTHCVQAYELRRRGFDVSATGLPRVHWPFGGRSISHIEGPWGRAFTSAGRRGIERAFRRYGPGSRGIVAIKWPDGGGHVFNVENVGGRIHFIDGQSNLVDATRHFRDGIGPRYVRLDDLPIPPGTIPHFAS